MSSDSAEDDMPPGGPAEMRERLAAGLDKLLAAIGGLDDRQLTEPRDAAGWNVRDHLLHLAAWADGIAALLRREDRWATMGVADPDPGPIDYDAMNEQIVAPLRHLSAAEARARLVAADTRVRQAVAALSDEELEQPYGRYAPPFTSDEGHPVGAYIAGNTFGHYEEHLPYIQRLVQA
jgi:hypothetical protein